MIFLKNYTSNVPVSLTLERIESVLVRCGVKGITKEYGRAAEPTAVHFHLERPDGGVHTIRVPAKVSQAQEALWKDYVGDAKLAPDGQSVGWPSKKRKLKKEFLEQATRTAWKIMQDWIEVQMSLIQLGQADAMEVFLPYLWNGKQTYYEALRENRFAGLLTENLDSVREPKTKA